MKVPTSLLVGVASLVGFVFGSTFHPQRVEARAHMTAHIEQVFPIPTGRETNGSIAGFSCAGSNGQDPQCYALIISGN